MANLLADDILKIKSNQCEIVDAVYLDLFCGEFEEYDDNLPHVTSKILVSARIRPNNAAEIAKRLREAADLAEKLAQRYTLDQLEVSLT